MGLDKNFWINTYNRNIKKLIGVCYRYVSDQKAAEDLAHDSFLTAMKKSGTFKGKGHFDAWLRKITVNTALQYLREIKKTRENQQELLQQELINIDEKMFLKYDFTIQELLEAINKLPEHHRLVFNLYVIDGFMHKQIAEKLDISVGTSKSHLARAKKKLQQLLNEKQETRKRSIVLLLFPGGFGGINQLYRKNFYNYEISTQNTAFINKIEWEESKLPRFNNNFNFINGTAAFGIIAITTGIILYHQRNAHDDFVDIPISQEITDTVSKNNQTTAVEINSPKKGHDTVLETKPIQKSNAFVVKKKRITYKKVIVRDTVTILDTNNAE